MKYKTVFIGITIAIGLFLTLYFIQDWASNVPGEQLNGQWQLEISQQCEGFLQECEEQVVTIPYHEFNGKPFYARFSKNFVGNYKFLVLPFISSSGYKVYLNDSLIGQVGDPENKTPNVWNHVQVLTLDPNILKKSGNILTIEIYALFTYGIDQPPILTDYPDTYIKVYIENLFRTYIPFISIGAAVLLGVILIVLGFSYSKTRKLFLYLGLCMFLSGIYTFEQRYRITTGSLQALLLMRKIASGSGFFATWFLLAAMEIYTTNKLKISKLLFIATAFVVIFGFLQPNIHAFSNWMANSTFLNIITILTAATLLIVNPKDKGWLIAPIFFLCLTFIHYLVTWHLLRIIGPNLSDIGLLYGSIGFGLILIVHFKELVRENLWMEKKNDELEIQKNEAIKLAQMKSEVVAQTSHEIRNPLMGIMGMTDKLLSKDLDKETEKDIHTIKNCSLNLQEILNDILDTAKIEAGKLVLHPSSFSLKQLLAEFDHTYSILAKQKGIEWEIDQDENCPEYIKNDRLRLSQILNNLLSNAVKFTEKGKVTLRVKADEKRLVFDVMDTGTGIEEHLHEQIFDPYSQLENSRFVVGTGLGLSIVKKLVKTFDGNLSLSSEKGKGSTFSVSIPYKKTQARQFELPIGVLQEMCLLIADDSKINLEVLKIYLSDMGFRKIHKASDGLQAFNDLQKNKYDLVIMDINMPGMTGTQIVEKIRHMEIAKDTLFVALTGMDISETAATLKTAGFKDVLSKPISKKQLINTIQTLLSEGGEKATNEIPEEIKQKLMQADIDEKTSTLIIREFLNEVPPTLKKIQEGILHNNFDQIYEGIHYMKSSLDYLGTEVVLEHRKVIEKASKQKDIETIKKEYDQFEQAIMDLIRIYQTYIVR
ncbi:MAG: ATP-binding protein [Thermotogota bacterium]|nr:ATP-binding protein [Thermotogota bacterium]